MPAKKQVNISLNTVENDLLTQAAELARNTLLDEVRSLLADGVKRRLENHPRFPLSRRLLDVLSPRGVFTLWAQFEVALAVVHEAEQFGTHVYNASERAYWTEQDFPRIVPDPCAGGDAYWVLEEGQAFSADGESIMANVVGKDAYYQKRLAEAAAADPEMKRLMTRAREDIPREIAAKRYNLDHLEGEEDKP